MRVLSIKDICSEILDGDWIESKDQSSSGIRLIQTGNVGNGFFKDKGDKCHYITLDTFNELNCTEIFEGDILISRLPDPIGRSCILPKMEQRMITAVDCSILRLNNDVCDKKYFVYYTLCEKYKEQISKYSTGATRKRISRKNLENITISVPPIADQQRIVEELDILESIIEKKKQQIEAIEEICYSIFFEMFGDPYKNEKGWQTSTFAKCIKLKSGDGLSAKNAIPGPYPIYGGNGISGYHKDFNMTGEHLIIGRVGVYCGNVHHVRGDFWLTDNAFESIFDKATFNYVFLTYLLRMLDLHQYANQAAQPVISNVVLKDISLIIPTKTDQELFAAKIESIEKQKQLIQGSIKQIATLLDATMEKYFG